ncbi:MAG TPA: hypothetical protein VGM70_01385 [Pseudolysinimonas sp.]|jgi:hypothetical protein
MNCLATTGTDPVLPFLIGALLICVGVVVAAIAVRRKRAGLALALVLLLGLGAGAGELLGAPAPAQAATCTSDPADPGTPSGGGTPCVPASAVADVAATSRADWAAGDPAGSTDVPLDAASALAWQTALDAINALGTPVFANGSVAGSDATNSESVVIAASGFTGTSGQVPANAAYVQTTEFDAATQGLTNPTVVLAFDLQYPDGCGGTLTTHFTATGPSTVTPPVCVPATAVNTPAVSEGTDWFPVDATHEGLTLSTSEVNGINSEMAAILAIDPAAVVATEGVNLDGTATFAVSGWSISGTTFEVDRAAYESILPPGPRPAGAVFEAWVMDYSDGCGGTLHSTFSVRGLFDAIIN